MKFIDRKQLDTLPGIRLKPDGIFSFRCHQDIACFNRCCRNLNLFLYPYDVLRLRKSLGLSSDAFLERHVDIVLREGNHFPEVLLTMADDSQNSCPFLSEKGCVVYADRPGTCRMFPMEHGELTDDEGNSTESIYLFRPPEFCRGPSEPRRLSVQDWVRDQGAGVYNEMAAQWAEVKRLFTADPWGPDGVNGPKGKMAFMAVYNVDRFREFVLKSSFLKRYAVKSGKVGQIRKNDEALLRFGFEWIKWFIWGIPSESIRPR